jgi:hypothetical protein
MNQHMQKKAIACKNTINIEPYMHEIRMQFKLQKKKALQYEKGAAACEPHIIISKQITIHLLRTLHNN